jgi:hypothetical protein
MSLFTAGPGRDKPSPAEPTHKERPGHVVPLAILSAQG